MMNRQLFYNGVKAYFSRPDAEFAMVKHPQKGEVCVYRGVSDKTGNDVSCGIGCMIPPALYSTEFENKTVSNILDIPVNGNGTLREFFNVNMDSDENFLNAIQHAHDDNFLLNGNASKMLDQLATVARDYGLIP